MIAVDTNVIVHAHRLESPFNKAAAAALSQLAEGTGTWAIPWPCLHEFLAVVTNRRAFVPPTPLTTAIQEIESLLRAPNLVLLCESAGHWHALAALLEEAGCRGGQVHDARIAAICLENGVEELWTADRDFSRFPRLKTRNPLVGR